MLYMCILHRSFITNANLLASLDNEYITAVPELYSNPTRQFHVQVACHRAQQRGHICIGPATLIFRVSQYCYRIFSFLLFCSLPFDPPLSSALLPSYCTLLFSPFSITDVTYTVCMYLPSLVFPFYHSPLSLKSLHHPLFLSLTPLLLCVPLPIMSPSVIVHVHVYLGIHFYTSCISL